MNRILPSIPTPVILTEQDVTDIADKLFEAYGCTEYNFISPSAFLGASEIEQKQGYYNPCKFYQWSVEVQRLNGRDATCLTALGRHHTDLEDYPECWLGKVAIGAD